MATEVSRVRSRSRLLPTIQEDGSVTESMVESVGPGKRPDRTTREKLARTPPASRLPRLVREAAPGSGGRGGRQPPALAALEPAAPPPGAQGSAFGEMVVGPPPASDRDRPARHRDRDRERESLAEEAVRLGPKADYFLGTDNIRRLLQQFDQDVHRFKLQFATGKPDSGPAAAQSAEPTPDKQTESDALLSARLQKAFAAIARAVDVVRTKTGDNLEPINSEQQILALITALKNLGEAATSEELVEFWEDLKYAVERVQALCDRFNQQILSKLRSSCLSFSGTLETHTPLSDRYSAEVARFVEQVETLWKNTRVLCASFGNGVKQRLLSETQATRDMARVFDVRRFAVVELVVDVIEKLTQMSRVARAWVDRDETFVLQLGREIRDMKRETQEKRRALEKEREQQEELLHSLKQARLTCENSRRHLLAIEDEIRILQREGAQGHQEVQQKTSQMQLKQQAVEFLQVAISQTKHNFAMKVKKQRLAKQIADLEASLDTLETELDKIEKMINEKERLASESKSKTVEDRRYYRELKREYEKLTVNILHLQKDMNQVQAQLTSLEMLHTFKTSPDVVDGFWDDEDARHEVIKLSPSFKRRLAEKRSRLTGSLATFSKVKRLAAE